MDLIETKQLLPFNSFSYKDIPMYFQNMLQDCVVMGPKDLKNRNSDKAWYIWQINQAKTKASVTIVPFCRYSDLQANTLHSRRYYKLKGYRSHSDEYLQIVDTVACECGTVLVFRIYHFRAFYYTGNDDLVFKETMRFCFLGKDAWVEYSNNDAPEPINESLIAALIWKNKTKKSKLRRIVNSTPVVLNQPKAYFPEIILQNKNKIVTCYPYLPYQTELKNLYTFFYSFSKLRKHNFFEKHIPFEIKEDVLKNKRHYQANVFHEKCIYSVKETPAYAVFSQYGEDGYENGRLYFQNGRFYQFDWNYFDQCFSSSRKDISLWSISVQGLLTVSHTRQDIANLKKLLRSIINTHGTKEQQSVSVNLNNRILLELLLTKRNLFFEQASKIKCGLCESNTNNVLDRLYLMDKRSAIRMANEIGNKKLTDVLPISAKEIRESKILNSVRDIRSIEFIASDLEQIKVIFPNIRFLIDSEIEISSYSLSTIANICKILLWYEDKDKIKKQIQNICKRPDATSLLYNYEDYLSEDLQTCAQMFVDEHHINQTFPKLVKPANITYMHNTIVAYYNRYRMENRLKQDSLRQKLFHKTVHEKAYQSFCYQDDTYSVIAPEKSSDLIEEGAYLSHCVGSYVGDVAEKRSNIYFIRKNEDINTPFFTVEVVDQSLRQCYTFYDHTNSDKKLRQFIKNWCKEKNIAIKCAV